MDQINAAAAAQLTAEGRRPFVIPVGGTTPTGTWGYIEAVHESGLLIWLQLLDFCHSTNVGLCSGNRGVM